MAFSKVDFPTPDGPITQATSPLETTRLTGLNKGIFCPVMTVRLLNSKLKKVLSYDYLAFLM